MTLAILIGTRMVTATMKDGIEEVRGIDNPCIDRVVHQAPLMMEMMVTVMMKARENLVIPSITLGKGISRTNDNQDSLIEDTRYQQQYTHNITHWV